VYAPGMLHIGAQISPCIRSENEMTHCERIVHENSLV